MKKYIVIGCIVFSLLSFVGGYLLSPNIDNRALQRADSLRREAAELRLKAEQLDLQATAIERQIRNR